MRAPFHTALIQVRVPPDLLAAAEAAAKRRMMSPSELVRAALRREVEAA